MNDQDFERLFDALKNEIPTNHALKENLRKDFVKKHKSKLYMKLSAAIIAAAILLTFVLPNNFVTEKVDAASLKISNQISFVDIAVGGNLGVCEYQGSIYVPVSGKGLFVYNSSGFHKLYDQEVNFVRISSDGKRLVFSSAGNISIYDLTTNTVREILKGDQQTLYYEQPSWSPDSKKIIYVKKVMQPAETHGFVEKESGIYEYNMANGTSMKLADGSYPSYIKGKGGIIFERDQNIIYRDLKAGKEQTVTQGRFPSTSPDGKYIAFVKTESTKREVSAANAAVANASVNESIENIWIADAVNFTTQKQVTSNYPNKSTDEKDWVGKLKPSETPQVLNINGAYSYYDPSWTSDSKSLLALKNSNGMEMQGNMRLIKIDFTNAKLSAQDTVRKYLQALIARDDDYAKSLMKSPPDILTGSNPHQIGYRILSTGKEGDMDYVDAEAYWGYTANPYYQIVRSRFYLTPNDNGFIIDHIQDLSTLEVSARDDTGTVYLVENKGEKQELFHEKDIPSEYIPTQKHRFASLAYSPDTDTMVFTIQMMQDNAQSSAVKILSFNRQNKQFKLIDTVVPTDPKYDTGVSNLTLDAGGRYAAVDFFSYYGSEFKNFAYVYNLQNADKTDLGSLLPNTDIENIKINYWDENDLIYNVTIDNESIKYIFIPDQLKNQVF